MRIIWFALKIGLCIVLALLALQLEGTFLLAIGDEIIEAPIVLLLAILLVWSLLVILVFQGWQRARDFLPTFERVRVIRRLRTQEKTILQALSAHVLKNDVAAEKILAKEMARLRHPAPALLVLAADMAYHAGDATYLREILKKMAPYPDLAPLIQHYHQKIHPEYPEGTSPDA